MTILPICRAPIFCGQNFLSAARRLLPFPWHSVVHQVCMINVLKRRFLGRRNSWYAMVSLCFNSMWNSVATVTIPWHCMKFCSQAAENWGSTDMYTLECCVALVQQNGANCRRVNSCSHCEYVCSFLMQYRRCVNDNKISRHWSGFDIRVWLPW